MLGKTIVCKFGGSSLANSTNIIGVKKIIDEHLSNKENRVIVVVSAPGVDKETMAGETKITDLLIELHNYYDSPSEFASVWNKIEARFLEIINSLGLEEQDVLAQVREEILKERDLDFTKSRGEYINALILSKYFKLPFVDARNNIIVSFENKVELEITRNHFSTIPHRNFIIPGFYGSCQGKIKCFSRGGSDITGSIVAIAVRARIYEK
jgi:aspartate kinase